MLTIEQCRNGWLVRGGKELTVCYVFQDVPSLMAWLNDACNALVATKKAPADGA